MDSKEGRFLKIFMHKVGYPNALFNEAEALYIRETISKGRDDMIEINHAVKIIKISNLEGVVKITVGNGETLDWLQPWF